VVRPIHEASEQSRSRLEGRLERGDRKPSRAGGEAGRLRQSQQTRLTWNGLLGVLALVAEPLPGLWPVCSVAPR